MLHCNNNVIYNTVEVLNEGPRSKLLHKEIDMFTTDFYIDTVQSGKKTFVNTFVQHEAVKKSLIDFIDSQTAYTKSVAKVTTDLGTTLATESVKQLSDFGKMDYSKFDFTKMFAPAK